MKTLLLFWLLLIFTKDFGQIPVKSYSIEITVNKTTNIIFPYAIRSVDRGSKDLLAQIAKGVDNVLQLKALRQNFPATTLSVITAEGKLYPFLALYAAEPADLNLSFLQDSRVQLNDQPINQARFDSLSSLVMNQPGFMHISARTRQVKLSLEGIYMQAGMLWFRFRLDNHSIIVYRPDYVQFFFQDKKQASRTAIQEIPILPINKVLIDRVAGNEQAVLVIAFTPFSIPKDKWLIAEINEKTGGLPLLLRIKNPAIGRARALAP
jgi:conjugative transposon TraN protein